MAVSLGAKHRQLGLQVEEIDAQHGALLALMSRITERDAEGASKQELASLLRQLEEMTAQHFKDEEAYLEETGCTKLDTHQIIHRELLGGLRRHQSDFEHGGGRLGSKLLSFIKFWLIAHLHTADKGLGAAGNAPGSGVRRTERGRQGHG